MYFPEHIYHHPEHIYFFCFSHMKEHKNISNLGFNSKISTPKTLLSQMDFSRVIRSIFRNLSYSVIYLQGYISKMGQTDFLYWPPARRIKSPKLDPRRIFLHRENIFSIIRRIYNPPRGRFHDQAFLFTTI